MPVTRAPPPGSREGAVPGAGGDVEDGLAGRDAGGGDDGLVDRDGERRDLVVVAAAPDLLLLGAQLSERIGGGDAHGGAFR